MTTRPIAPQLLRVALPGWPFCRPQNSKKVGQARRTPSGLPRARHADAGFFLPMLTRSTNPGDLRRAIHEAARHKAGMLSYSPRQIVTGLTQRSLMPLVFSELALAYPPGKVSDPAQRIAAANGQFLLVEREAYRRIGGHPAAADRGPWKTWNSPCSPSGGV